ncbi:hypothetical protein B0H14DRAFT_3879860 [Mycena olivaceomarginata]|nr:hypothetical protein B0H14DRAFT_3879860 [Mycena olivaceomarginata]
MSAISYQCPPRQYRTAPFDAQLEDHSWNNLAMDSPMPLGGNGTVWRYGTIIIKEYGSCGSDEEGESEPERVWNLIQLAGDCCVRTGRLFREGLPVGFCMPMETPLASATIANKEERLRLIQQVRDLVAKLHSRNIVHGDLKPQNILLCSDGRVRLCDFDNASIEGDGYVTEALTPPYCSQFQDTYALGLTIWELYTGRMPLTYGDESMEDMLVWEILENRVNVGMRPDMTLIDDPAIRALIEECLAAAPECPIEFWRDSTFCVETQFEFNRCRAEPRHLYSRIVHRWTCSYPNGPCEYPYMDPKIYPSSTDPVCLKCEPAQRNIIPMEEEEGDCLCGPKLKQQFTVFFLSLVISNVPPTRPEWVYINYLWQAFPLLFLPLTLLPCSPAPTNKTSSSLSISMFTVYKYIYGPAWWAALGAGLNAYFRHGETFNSACYFMVVDVVGFVMLFLGMYAVDAVAGDAREVMGMGRLLGGFVVLGPASTMAAYFEGQQRVAVERAEAEWIKKV